MAGLENGPISNATEVKAQVHAVSCILFDCYLQHGLVTLRRFACCNRSYMLFLVLVEPQTLPGSGSPAGWEPRGVGIWDQDVGSAP